MIPLSLADSLPKQQQRVRALMDEYRSIGPAGTFALAMMEQALRRAETASAAGDIAEMIRAHEELRGFE